MDLFSLFLFADENNKIKSPTKISDFTVNITFALTSILLAFCLLLCLFESCVKQPFEDLPLGEISLSVNCLNRGPVCNDISWSKGILFFPFPSLSEGFFKSVKLLLCFYIIEFVGTLMADVLISDNTSI